MKLTMVFASAVLALALAGCFHNARTEQGVAAIVAGGYELMCDTKLAETERQMREQWGPVAMQEKDEFCAAVQEYQDAQQE